MNRPKRPKETAEERALRDRQRRELDRATEAENRRRKLIAFGRLGTRQLLSGSALGILDEGMATARLGGTNPGRSSSGRSTGGTGGIGGGIGGGTGGGGSAGGGVPRTGGDLRLR